VFRVGISGSYGGLNLGDEAILQGIIEQLGVPFPLKSAVFSKDRRIPCGDMRLREPFLSGLSSDEILLEIKRLDLVYPRRRGFSLTER